MIPKDLKFEWDNNKSKLVKRKHGKSLEEIVQYIKSGKVLSFQKHINQARYPNQMLIVLDVDGYPWVVPCEFRGDKLRLITAYPNRKFKTLLRRNKDEK